MSHDDAPPFESREVTRLKLPAIVRLLPFVAILPQIPRLLDRSLGLDPSVTAMVSLAATTLLFIGVFLGLKRLNDRNAETGAIHASSEGVRWNGELILARDRINGGVVMPDAPGGTRVRLARRWKAPVEFGVKNVEQGRELLRSLGLDASQVTATFRSRSPVAASRLAMPVYLVGLFAAVFAAVSLGLSPFTTMLPLMAFLIAFVWPQKVVVGTDGVLLSWIVRRRFVPYSELVRIDDTKTGLELVTRSGEKHRIEFNQGRGSKSHRIRAQAERDSLRSRIEQSMAASPSAAPALDPALVARGERDVTSWLDSLRSIARREGGMRTAPVLREQLFAILANTGLAASVRAGAAAALGLDAVPAERERLKDAAASIASPRVRVVVEAAAKGNEAAMVEALDDVRDEQAEKRAAG